MNTDKKNLGIRIMIFALIMLAIIVIMRVVVKASQTTGKYDTFAQCLTDKGLKFYGAFWCPHCQAEKRRFGGSAKLLPYVECSTPDGKGQTQVCIDKGIKSYPTWFYPDGTSTTGEVELADLGAKSGCTLPDGTTPTTPNQSTAGASSSAN